MRTFVSSAIIALALTAPLGAQTWQAIGVPTGAGTGAYWDNRSYDRDGNLVCNIGALLTTPNVSDANCVNIQDGILPSTPAPLTASNLFLGGAAGAEPGAGGFRFAAGTYSIVQQVRISQNLGDQWGIVLDNGTVFTGTQLGAGAITVSTPFAIWLAQAQPPEGAGTIYTSDRRVGGLAVGARTTTLQQQFAVFTNGTGVGALGGLSTDAFGTIINSTGQSAVYYVGMEDIVNGGRNFPVVPGVPSDRDYQDIVISITSVPEPATVVMMLTGLAGLVLVARRRRA